MKKVSAFTKIKKSIEEENDIHKLQRIVNQGSSPQEDLARKALAKGYKIFDRRAVEKAMATRRANERQANKALRVFASFFADSDLRIEICPKTVTPKIDYDNKVIKTPAASVFGFDYAVAILGRAVSVWQNSDAKISFKNMPPLVAAVARVLEDARCESVMGKEFQGYRKTFRQAMLLFQDARRLQDLVEIDASRHPIPMWLQGVYYISLRLRGLKGRNYHDHVVDLMEEDIIPFIRDNKPTTAEDSKYLAWAVAEKMSNLFSGKAQFMRFMQTPTRVLVNQMVGEDCNLEHLHLTQLYEVMKAVDQFVGDSASEGNALESLSLPESTEDRKRYVDLMTMKYGYDQIPRGGYLLEDPALQKVWQDKAIGHQKRLAVLEFLADGHEVSPMVRAKNMMLESKVATRPVTLKYGDHTEEFKVSDYQAIKRPRWDGHSKKVDYKDQSPEELLELIKMDIVDNLNAPNVVDLSRGDSADMWSKMFVEMLAAFMERLVQEGWSMDGWDSDFSSEVLCQFSSKHLEAALELVSNPGALSMFEELLNTASQNIDLANKLVLSVATEDSVSDIDISPMEDGDQKEFDLLKSTTRSLTDAFITEISKFLTPHQAVSEVWQRDLVNGVRLDHKRLTRLPLMDQRLFRKRVANTPHPSGDCVFTILVDESASMEPVIDMARSITVALAEALDNLGVTFEVLGFTVDNEAIRNRVYKSFDEGFYEVRSKLTNICCNGGNDDLSSLRTAVERQRLLHDRFDSRFLVVIGDAYPCCSESDLREEYKKLNVEDKIATCGIILDEFENETSHHYSSEGCRGWYFNSRVIVNSEESLISGLYELLAAAVKGL